MENKDISPDNNINTEENKNIDNTAEQSEGTAANPVNHKSQNRRNSKGKLPMFNKNAALRSVKYGSNALVMIAAFVAIAVILNILIGFLNLSLDLTPNHLYSLSSDNKEYLNSITDREIEIVGLFDDASLPENDYAAVQRLLEEYDAFSNITVSYVDPDKNPGYINEHVDPNGVLSAAKGDFVVICGERRRLVSSAMLFNVDEDDYGNSYNYSMKAEDSISGAINYVVADSTPTIYFLQGHGELDFTQDFSIICSYLDYNNYKVEPLNLLTVDSVPADAILLMSVAPTLDLTIEEKIKLEQYLTKNRGNMMVFADSLESNEKFTNLQSILALYNLELNYDIVKETGEFASTTDPYVFYSSLQTNDINTAFSQMQGSMKLLMTETRSINVLKNAKAYLTTTPLVKSGTGALGEARNEYGKDTGGPLDLVVATEYTSAGKMVVFGTSQFMADVLYSSSQTLWYYGYAFFANTLNWIHVNEDALQITAKVFNTEKITISATNAFYIAIIIVVLIPLIIMVSGIVVWLKRRHR